MKLNLNKVRWGGRRSGAGRKRIQSPGIAHRTRPKLTPHKPTHITVKYKINIRNKEFLRILKRAILNSRVKGLRILHYSVQSNHVHFIIEADNNKNLSSGMRSLTVTLAKGVGRGKIQLHRFHLHILKSLRETKNAIKYVVFNEQKHNGKRIIDAYSSVGHYLNLKFDYGVTKMDRPVSWLSSARD